MPIDDEAQLALSYTPSTYASLDASKAGRWVELPELGTLWTDDAEGLGILFSGGGGDQSGLVQLISDYKEMGANAGAAFDALTLVYEGGEPSSGLLSEVATPTPVTAAAADGEPVTDGEEIFAAFRDEELVDVGRAAPDGMYLREKGEWVRLPDTDLRFDDTEWLPLDDAGVAKYDEAEKSGTTLARADVESPAPES